MTEIGFTDLVADQSAGVKDCRHRIELHRLDHIFLDDADLERKRRHGPPLNKKKRKRKKVQLHYPSLIITLMSVS